MILYAPHYSVLRWHKGCWLLVETGEAEGAEMEADVSWSSIRPVTAH